MCRGGGKTVILKRDLDFHEYFKAEDETLGFKDVKRKFSQARRTYTSLIYLY